MAWRFDNKGSLWILNSQTKSQSILELKPDGTMTPHHQNTLTQDGVGLSVMSHAMFDSKGLLWFCNKHFLFPGLFCYETATGELNSYTKFINQDGSTVAVTLVTCLTEDLNKDIWVGTNVGPLVLKRSQMNNPDETVSNR